ncbi:DUF4362 domain-containing protein [Paenibacillus ferrarius]
MLLILLIIAWTSYTSLSNQVVISDYNVVRAIRMEKFVHRFNEKHSDRLFFMQSTIEGGYVLSDLHLSKNEITFTIDYSRDSYSTQASDSISCRSIKRKIENFNIVYSLSQCDQFPKDQDIPIISLGIK